MKICFVIPSLNHGGAELLLRDVSNQLVKRGISVQIVVLSVSTDLIDSFSADVEFKFLNDRVLSSFSRKAFFNSWKYRKELKSIFEDFEPDHIIAHLPISHHIVRLVALTNNFGIKIWMHHHSLQYEANPIKTISQKTLFYLTKFLSKKLDFGHIFISKSVLNHVSSRLGTSKNYVLLNSVVDKYQLISETKKPNEFEQKYNIVVPGRLVKEKGHLPFLNAIKSFVEKKNIIIHIIGEGPERMTIESFVNAKGLNERVKMHGRMDQDELLKYMYHSDIIIVPSLIEGFGMVAAEALMLNKICIVSDAGGLTEVIDDNRNGFVFKSGNFGDLNLLLNKLYQNDQANERLTIRESYLNKFTIESYVDKLLSILSSYN